jgi:hypothetical protein
VVSGLIAIEPDDRRDETDSVGGLGIAPEEIVLGQRPHHAVATKKQRQRLNDCGLAAVVGADEHGMRPEPNVTGSDAAKVLNMQVCNLHGVRFPHRPVAACSFVFLFHGIG